MIADGQVRPIIGAEIPIEQARAAHELLASGEVSGKVLLPWLISRQPHIGRADSSDASR